MKETAGIDLFFSSFDSNLNRAAQVEVGLLKLLIIPILVKLTICSLKIHHGIHRINNADEFQKKRLEHDIVITSFSLTRKDEKLFQTFNWHRIVVDEAQNIKNPKAAQTRAILKLKFYHLH